MKKLNIYILTYNRSLYLKETIASVLSQTYKDFKLIILDNASSDNTKEIVNTFSDKRIEYIRHEKNIGEFGNASFALKHCRAKYFIMFHDDDLMHPEMVEREIHVMDENPDAAAVGVNAVIFGDTVLNGTPFFPETEKIESYSFIELFSRLLKTGSTFVYPSIMYRTDFINTHNIRVTNEGGPCSDVVFYFNIANSGGCLYQIQRSLMRYRIHKGQDSNANNYTMNLQLYEFFNKSVDYQTIFLSLSKERKSAFNRISKSIISGWISNSLDKEMALDLITKYGIQLHISSKRYMYILKLLAVAPSVSKFLYGKYRALKYK